jgi:hypothetical protein
MNSNDGAIDPVETQTELVTHVLEHDQLSQAEKRPVPRRQLSGPVLLVLWSLRIYLLFMIAVVIYQIVLSMR